MTWHNVWGIDARQLAERIEAQGWPASLLNVALVTFLANNENPDQSEIMALVFHEYNVANNTSISPESASGEERMAVAKWLRSPDVEAMMMAKPRLLRPLFFDSLGAKLEWLRQYPCNACATVLPVRHFAIRIEPRSYQADSARLRRAFKDAVGSWYGFTQRHHHQFETEPLCVRLVLVLGSKARMKDVDNIPKGILDGMIGKLYQDDKQIQHLDLIRVSTPDEQGFVMVRVAPTELMAHKDVVSIEPLTFVNPEVINVADFLS